MNRQKNSCGRDDGLSESPLKTVRCSRCSAVIMRSFLTDHLRYVHGVSTGVDQTTVYEPGSGRGPKIKREKPSHATAATSKQKRLTKTQKEELTPLQRRLRARTNAVFEPGWFRIWLADRPSSGSSFLGGVKPAHVAILRGGLPSLGKRK